MPDLLIRDVSTAVIKNLKIRAKQHHRSLQGELRFIVETAAKISMGSAKKLSDEWLKRLSGHSFSDSAAILREDRKR